MGLEKPMTSDAIRFTAQTIVDRYSWLNPDDIILFLTCVAQGKYGPIYGRLDAPTILGYLDKYIDSRIDHAAARSMRRHESIRAYEGDVQRTSTKR